MDDEVKKIIF